MKVRPFLPALGLWTAMAASTAVGTVEAAGSVSAAGVSAAGVSAAGVSAAGASADASDAAGVDAARAGVSADAGDAAGAGARARARVGESSSPRRLVEGTPAEVKLDARVLDRIDREVAEALRQRRMPGCVVAIGRHGRLALLRAYGNRRLLPDAAPMTVDTVFDLASLTKPIATATSVMLLVERGAVELDAPVARYLPEFAVHGKGAITVRQLLTHQGGLIADNALADYAHGLDESRRRLLALKPVATPATRLIYSDVGFMVLGEMIRRVSGKNVDAFAGENLLGPLGMHETTFRPGEALQRRAAPTELRDGRWIQGEVHDPRAFRLEGVAGHAGLFSTARDLAVFAQMLLDRGGCEGVRVLRPETVHAMFRPCVVPGGLRGLGWDLYTGFSTNRGSTMSPRAVGHGGFTGTALWIDPAFDLFVIFLSNRVHPDGKRSVNELAGRIGTIAVDAVTDMPGACFTRWPRVAASVGKNAAAKTVLCGIDVLRRDGFGPLRGRRVGLITNHTGVAQDGAPDARILQDAPGVTLVALFSPEHGFEGKLDQNNVADAGDPVTGLPVRSLYGKTRRPTPEMLRGIDTLVFDIQDVGARFYTYVSTMGLAMEAAAAQGLRFVVLDRPNPIGGVAVAGPVLDPGRESFVGYHRLPVRHGMTVGELAVLFHAQRRLALDLHVVCVEGWRRADDFDATRLRWIAPSPNMRSPAEALLYPGIGLLEMTNLSVGRGTETPFEWIGAPWLDGPALAAALEAAQLPGVRFQAAAQTPASSRFAGRQCGGVRITVTDRHRFEPVRTGLRIARTLRDTYPQTWEAPAVDRLLGNAAAIDALLAGKSIAEIEAAWQPDLQQFLTRRAKCLLYD